MSATVKLAQRLLERHELAPRIDIRSLLERYADVIEVSIPIQGVDGVCLNLKVPGKRPRVIINSNSPPLRRRFTEAHELGHIIIPWHRGAIVDNLEPQNSGAADDYWTFETEANQFAAEILMPSDWVSELIRSTSDLSICHKRLCTDCEVSALAGSMRLASLLPPNIVYVAERNADVEFSGRTLGTLATLPIWSSRFNPDSFPYATTHHVANLGARKIHWWTLPHEVRGISEDPRPWREVLDAIVEDIGIPDSQRKRFKMSVNGVLSAANSAVRQRGPHTCEAVIAACLQRFHDRVNWAEFTNHGSFKDFIVKRAVELTNL